MQRALQRCGWKGGARARSLCQTQACCTSQHSSPRAAAETGQREATTAAGKWARVQGGTPSTAVPTLLPATGLQRDRGGLRVRERSASLQNWCKRLAPRPRQARRKLQRKARVSGPCPPPPPLNPTVIIWNRIFFFFFFFFPKRKKETVMIPLPKHVALPAARLPTLVRSSSEGTEPQWLQL